MSAAPFRGGSGARDDRPSPVLLPGGDVVLPAIVVEELVLALDRLEAYERGTPPPRRQGRLTRGTWAVRDVTRVAALRFRALQESQAAYAAATVAVLTAAKGPSVSDRRQLTTEQAATLAGVSETRIRQLAAAGTISGRKTSRNVWLLDPESVREFARRRGSRHDDTHRTGHCGTAGAGAA